MALATGGLIRPLMPKLTMTRRAADNAYCHPDFHGALSLALDYLEKTYGAEAVRDYLRRFTLSYYAPLREALRERGLAALAEHFRAVYAQEGGEAEIICSEETLVIKVCACPAVRHLRARGYPIARLWGETTRTVNETLCEGTPYLAEFLAYNPETGAAIQLFRRRQP